jgi:hypothetical protein
MIVPESQSRVGPEENDLHGIDGMGRGEGGEED